MTLDDPVTCESTRNIGAHLLGMLVDDESLIMDMFDAGASECDFITSDQQRLMTTLLERWDHNMAVSRDALAIHIQTSPDGDHHALLDELRQLPRVLPRADEVRRLSRTLRELSRRRAMRGKLFKCLAMIDDLDTDFTQVLNSLEAMRINDIDTTVNLESPSGKSLVNEVVTLADPSNQPGKVMKTGLGSYCNLLRPRQTVLIYANHRDSYLPTLTSLLHSTAIEHRTSVLFYSPICGQHETIQRLLAHQRDCLPEHLRQPQIHGQLTTQLQSDARWRHIETILHIVNDMQPTPRATSLFMLRMLRRHPIQMLVIEPVSQILSPSTVTGHEEGLDVTVRWLRTLAWEYNVPVVMFASADQCPPTVRVSALSAESRFALAMPHADVVVRVREPEESTEIATNRSQSSRGLRIVRNSYGLIGECS